MPRARTLPTLLLVAASLSACSADLADKPEGTASAAEAGDGKADRWDFAGSPTRFEIPLRTSLAELPREGRAAVIPWTDTYWPTTEDSFNARWNGRTELSPLEKYDAAFNGWTPPPGFLALRPLTRESCADGSWDPEYYDALGPAARYWSDTHGVGRARNGRDDDGDGRIDECDDLDGMEHWWGSCHAWVPASLLEAEPLEPVTVNSVTFHVSDIKALLILQYEESSQIAVGERCLQENPARDPSGRIQDPACRAVNAGTFHLLMGNLLGLEHRAFGEDRIATREVWNQPVAGYRITRQEERTEAQALALLHRPETRYPFNPAARRFVEVNADVDYVVESYPSTEPTSPIIDHYIRTDHYRYVLELDDAGAIVGGEWIDAAAGTTYAHTDRPDYLWLPLGPGRPLNAYVSPTNVRQLARQSRPDTRNLVSRSFEQRLDVRIPDIDPRGVRGTIDVPDDLVPQHVTVRVQVLHDFTYDLVIRLLRNGREVELFDHNPRGSTTSLVASFPVDAFAGESARGRWEIVVADTYSHSSGRFVDWGIELVGQASAPPPPPPPVDPGTPPPSAAERSYASTGAAASIPDNSPTGIESVIDVPDDLVAEQVTLTATIEHSYIGDLQVAISHGGVEQVVHDRTGGSTRNLGLEVPLTGFRGARVGGPWRLRVRDMAPRDTGRLSGWGVRVTGR